MTPHDGRNGWPHAHARAAAAAQALADDDNDDDDGDGSDGARALRSSHAPAADEPACEPACRSAGPTTPPNDATDVAAVLEPSWLREDATTAKPPSAPPAPPPAPAPARLGRLAELSGLLPTMSHGTRARAHAGAGGACGVPSVSTLLAAFFASPTVERTCPEAKCGCRYATVLAAVETPPRALLLHLKRFQPLPSGDGWRKSAAPVRIEPELDLTPFLAAGTAKATYALRAIVRHHGRSLVGGHYTAECLVAPELAEDGAGVSAAPARAAEWLRFDDSHVSQLDGFPGAAAAHDAYLLAYERVGADGVPNSKILS